MLIRIKRNSSQMPIRAYILKKYDEAWIKWVKFIQQYPSLEVFTATGGEIQKYHARVKRPDYVYLIPKIFPKDFLNDGIPFKAFRAFMFILTGLYSWKWSGAVRTNNINDDTCPWCCDAYSSPTIHLIHLCAGVPKRLLPDRRIYFTNNFYDYRSTEDLRHNEILPGFTFDPLWSFCFALFLNKPEAFFTSPNALSIFSEPSLSNDPLSLSRPL